MVYTFINKETKDTYCLGTDTLFWVDGRLNIENVKIIAKQKIKSLQAIRPSFNPQYIAPYKLRSKNYSPIIKL